MANITNPLKFYKGWYGKSNGNALPEHLPNVSTAIIFNEEEGVLYLNGKRYGGATDVTFTDGVLTITYSDGRTPISLDFNDTASASETMKVFEQIANLIGENIMNGGETLNYSGTNYLAGESSDSDDDAKSLVEADRILDSEIKKVNNKIEELDATNVQGVVYTAASGNDGAKLTFAGVSQTDGQVAQGSGDVELQFAKVATTSKSEDVSYDDTHSAMGTQDNPVNTVQKAIETIDSRVKEIETIDVFDTVVAKDAATTPDSITGGSLVASADTMHKIYLVEADANEGVPTGTYNEWITVRGNLDSDSDLEYNWELIGSTQANLEGYVKNIVVNGKTYSVTTDNTVTLTDVITKITGESTDLNNTDYINVKATTTKDETNGTNITVLKSSVKTQTLASATQNADGLATAYDVKSRFESLDASKEDYDDENYVGVSLKQTDGLINSLGVNVTYATVTYGDNGNSDATLSATNGILLGSDVSKFADFTNNRISEEIAKLDNTVVSDQLDSDSEPVQVTVTQEDGLVNRVQVDTLGADVYFVGGGSEPEDITISNLNGIVLGRDILELKDYIDAKANDSATVVTNSNGQNDALVLESTNTNGKMTYDINLCWTEFGEQPQNNTQNNG